MRTLTWIATMGFFLALAGVCCHQVATSTPLYSARAGRTCDNCHLTPNNWENPALAERKCTLSCQVCHVDPTGGGMRNTSGRFYGKATLPMIATSPRPTQDWDRTIIGRKDRATTYSHNLPLGPDTFEESFAYNDSVRDFWGRGTPWGKPTRYGFFEGRYGTLRADPFFRFGWDIRLAALLAGNALVFPMQADFPIALHPVQHAMLFVNTGFRGSTSGFGDPFDDDREPYLREAFLMLYEAPYQAYVKAGRFVPGFGLRIDDHTSAIRRQFELDGALPESRVTGIEVGAAPNYPFVNLSWFRMTPRNETPDRWNIFDVGDGWGTAVNLGYRELGWSLGGSALIRRRTLEDGGDTSVFGVYGAFNPWFYWVNVPLTYQAEFDVGSYQRASGLTANNAAFYGELDWLLTNGINLLFAHDWADPDADVIEDEFTRLQVGVQIVPYPGVTFDCRVRLLVPTFGGRDADLFVQFHFWN
jgi:hypothetical protein